MTRRQRLAKRLITGSFAKLLQYMHGTKRLPEGRGVALLTSQNPRENHPGIPEGEQPPKPVTPKDNRDRFKQLTEDLKQRGFAYWKAIGDYGALEKSVAVLNITPEQALAFGRKYNQESVIWSGVIDGHFVHRMLYSNSGTDAAQPVVDKQLWAEAVKNDDQYFTKMDNRKFSIPFFPGDKALQPLPEKVMQKLKGPAAV